jgi:UDPglucose 6-dehydrogenase/GDP-mannose 6-dehydrogenase
VTAYDPIARSEAEAIFGPGDIVYADSLDDCVADAEVIVLVTRWAIFDQLAELIAERTPQPLVVDGRRMLDKNAFRRYEGIGS